MGSKQYEEVRLYLFANSYSGRRIITYLKTKCKKRKLSQRVKRLATVLDFNFRKLKRLINDDLIPTCPYKRLPNKLKIYLEIEKELSALVEEKLDEYSTALEDYQRQMLAPAIERAAGNLTKDIDDRKFDRILEQQIRRYTYTYYRTAYKYKLPTLRIVPFIIRLIA